MRQRPVGCSYTTVPSYIKWDGTWAWAWAWVPVCSTYYFLDGGCFCVIGNYISFQRVRLLISPSIMYSNLNVNSNLKFIWKLRYWCATSQHHVPLRYVHYVEKNNEILYTPSRGSAVQDSWGLRASWARKTHERSKDCIGSRWVVTKTIIFWALLPHRLHMVSWGTSL